MSEQFIISFDHLRFSKDGRSLVVTSGRDSGFEELYPWPDDVSIDDDNIEEELHGRYYLDTRQSYQSYSE